MNSTPQFNWQRFWVPRDGEIDLSDGGFFVDPTREYARGRGGKQLEELDEYRALVLLGEPGIGKSTTLQEEDARLRAQEVAGLKMINADLRAYSSESLLYKRVFESPSFLAWANDTSQLILQLDSLDEALLRIDTIANLLADELPRLPTTRLSVRIACRTAVWPSSILEPTLRNIWGKSAVGVFELAPLRRRDVAAAAEAVGIDADKFFQELYTANVVAFAIRPLTLNLLLDLFKKDGKLPRSVADIYHRGCLKLCDEQNPSRRDSGRLGSCTAAQRLRVASRIAAATIFANRYAVWTGPEGEGMPEEDIQLSSIAGSEERGDFPTFQITDAAIRETLDSGLFTSRGGNRMGWAHQGYAEFLAASYIHAKEVTPTNVLKLVLHPNGGLIPQLGVAAAWIASISKGVREELIRVDPIVLLQGDLSGWSNFDLESLTRSALTALDKNLSSDFFLLSTFYGKLNHPGLAAQLRPYISDASKHVASRRAAIVIAERCRLPALQPDLLNLALNSNEDAHLRGRAISALSVCGDERVPSKLIAIAKGELGADPQDEMKGYALEILWPNYLSAEELFALLTRPSDGFVGSYVMFLTRTLPDKLTIGNLPTALRWATALGPERIDISDFHLRSLADSIFIRAWRHLDRPEIADLLLTYVMGRLRAHHELIGGTSMREIEAFRIELEADSSQRRKFLLLATRLPLDDIDAYHLLRAGLLKKSDLAWLLSLCPGGADYNSGLVPERLYSLVRQLIDLYDAADFEALYTAAVKWDLLWEKYRLVFEGVPLASADAQNARQQHEQLLELQARKRPPITLSPEKLVSEQLDLFESGDWAAWWRLNRYLTLTPESSTYGSDLDYSISKMPGWQRADLATRRRILNAASRYLVDAETSISEWIGKNPFTMRLNDLAAYRAMLLLKEFDQDAYRKISSDAWAKWAAVIVAIQTQGGGGKAEHEAKIFADALSQASSAFVGAVRTIMRGERERASAGAGSTPPQMLGASFFILHQLEGCWNSEKLKKSVFAELRDESNSEDQFASILRALLEAEFVPAREFAIGLLRDRRDPRFVKASAIEIATHQPGDAWASIRDLFINDSSFGESFFLEIGQRYRFHEPILAGLNEDQLADVYVYLERIFPREGDPQHPSGTPHFSGPRENLMHFRDDIPRQISSRGTTAAVAALRWIISQLPQLTWLSFHLLDAERIMRMRTWAPLSPKELFSLLAAKSRILVRSAEDLREALVALLRKYARELHGEHNPVRALWDRQAGGKVLRPIEEDGFTDNVISFLKRELVERGIVVNREVEIARIPGAPIGRRTDIKVDAMRRSSDGLYDTLTAVIESKGCWNKQLFTALKDQLYDDYMVRLRAPLGIYLVAWFDKSNWDPKDHRRAQAPNLTAKEIETQLEAQAVTIPAGYVVEPIVVDCHAPEQDAT